MELQDKINLFKKEGNENLLIITDFDGTLTKGYKDDGGRASLIAILRDNDFMSFDYQEKAKALFSKYHPIEIDPNISSGDKIDAMRNWWNKHFDLLAKSGVDKDVIEQIAKSDLLSLREGIDGLFEFQKKYLIPMLIFSSAGVGDVIELYLKNTNKVNNELHLITNFWNYDENGKFIGVKCEVIHGMNKGVGILKGNLFYNKYREGKNVILIGDSLSDLNMIEGFDYNNIITIGFFNQRVGVNFNDEDRYKYELMREKYYEEFDVVIEGDGDMNEVNELLKSLV